MAVVGKGILAAGSALSRKASSALAKKAAKRKAERAARQAAKKAQERAAKRAATRAKEIKAARDKANRAKKARSGTTPKKPTSAYKEGHGKINPKTASRAKRPSKPTQGASTPYDFQTGYNRGKLHYLRKLGSAPKAIAKNRFAQMTALSGASGYIGAKTAGGSSSNTVSSKSSYTQADYDEARRRIYGR